MQMRKKNLLLHITAGIVALLLFVCVPSVKTDAAPAAPADATQTVSLENGFQVQWTPVAGATQYYYSFSTDKKTYTEESPTGNGGKDTFVNVSNEVLTPGTFYYIRVRAFDGAEFSQYVEVKAATAPKAPAGIRQTQADSSSVTVTWDASAGASGYLVRFGSTQAKAKDIQRITTTTCKLTGLEPDSAYYIAVYPIKKVTKDFYASQNFVDNAKIVTTASAVTGVKMTHWDVKNNVVMLQWDNTAKYETGYQIELYKSDGTTKLKTYNIRGRKAAMKVFSLKKVKNTPFQYRVRTFTSFGGQKSYGDWSEFAYAVPQADVSAKKVSDKEITLSWKPVEGAGSYTVYQADKEGGKLKKVASTKKTEYNVAGLKTYKDYYFMVKANKVSMGGKNRKSNTLAVPNDINVFIYKYQDNVTEE